MFLLGVEEPLQADASLRHWGSRSPADEMLDQSVAELNRYSFVWFGEWGTAVQGANKLIHAIYSDVDASTALFECAAISPRATELQSHPVQRKIVAICEEWATEGWQQCSDTSVFAAVKYLRADEPLQTPAAGPFKFGWRRCPAIIGPPDAALSMMRPPFRSVVERFAPTRLIVPGLDFLSGLAAQRIGIIYPRTDDLGRKGVVLITPQRLHLDTMIETGLLAGVEIGAGAESVWRHGPSGL